MSDRVYSLFLAVLSWPRQPVAQFVSQIKIQQEKVANAMRDAFGKRDELRHLVLCTVFLRTACGSRQTGLGSSEGDARQNVASTLQQHVAFAKKQFFEQDHIDLL